MAMVNAIVRPTTIPIPTRVASERPSGMSGLPVPISSTLLTCRDSSYSVSMQWSNDDNSKVVGGGGGGGCEMKRSGCLSFGHIKLRIAKQVNVTGIHTTLRFVRLVRKVIDFL